MLVVKTRVFASASIWLQGDGRSASRGGALAAAMQLVTSRLEAVAQLLCGGSWLQLEPAACEKEEAAACTWLHRAAAWWFFLVYLYALSTAIS